MKFFNVHDVLTIGVSAFLFVYLFNKALGMVGLGDYRASSSGTGQAMPAAGSASSSGSMTG